MVDRDPFDILRDNNQVDPGGLPDGSSPQGRQLLNRIKSGGVVVHRTRTRRPLVIGVLSLLLIAAITITWSPPENVQGITCFDSTDLEGTRVGVAPEGEISAERCAPLWSDEVLSNPAVAQPGEVPPLLGCVSEEGALWVFPTDDPGLCNRLGLDRAEEAATPNPVLTMSETLADYFASQECLTMDDAVQKVQSVLSELALDDWTIEVQPISEERPCASLAIDTDTTTILLVPMPRSG